MFNCDLFFWTYKLQILQILTFCGTPFLRIDAYPYGWLPHHENTKDRCLRRGIDILHTVQTKNSTKLL